MTKMDEKDLIDAIQCVACDIECYLENNDNSLLKISLHRLYSTLEHYREGNK